MSRGLDISEEEMESSEKISDSFYDLAKASSNPQILRLLKEHTPESLTKYYDEIGKLMKEAKKKKN